MLTSRHVFAWTNQVQDVYTICLLRGYCNMKVHQHGGCLPILGSVNISSNIWSLWQCTVCRLKTCSFFYAYLLVIHWMVFELICYCVREQTKNTNCRPFCLLFFWIELITIKRSFFLCWGHAIHYCNRPVRKIISLHDDISVWTEEKSTTFAVSKNCLHSIEHV